MTKSSMNLWGRFLFRDRGILPTKKLLILLIILSISLIITTIWGASWWFILATNIVVFLLSLLDLFFSPKKDELKIKRIMPEEMERGIVYSINVEVENTSRHSIKFQIRDGIPQSFARPFPLHGEVLKKLETRISYETRAPVRGEYAKPRRERYLAGFLRYVCIGRNIILWRSALGAQLSSWACSSRASRLRILTSRPETSTRP